MMTAKIPVWGNTAVYIQYCVVCLKIDYTLICLEYICTVSSKIKHSLQLLLLASIIIIVVIIIIVGISTLIMTFLKIIIVIINVRLFRFKKTNLTCNSTAFNVTYVSSAARGALVWWRHISTVLKNGVMHIEKIMLQKSFAHLTYAGNVRSSLSCNKRTHVVFKSLIDYLN